jgi:hypothetical protein
MLQRLASYLVLWWRKPLSNQTFFPSHLLKNKLTKGHLLLSFFFLCTGCSTAAVAPLVVPFLPLHQVLNCCSRSASAHEKFCSTVLAALPCSSLSY